MKKIGILLVALVLASCSAVRVQYDYDRTADFSAYATYNYYADMDTGLSELDEKRLIKAIDFNLRDNGIRLSEEPDILIDIKSRSYTGIQRNTVGVGIGGSGRNVGGGVNIGIPMRNSKLEREVQIDFVDSQKEALVWQATAISSFYDNSSPEVREQKFLQLVTKAFSKYPPKK